MCKILHSLVAIIPDQHFIPVQTVRGPHKQMFCHRHSNTNYQAGSYFIRVIPLWNALPPHCCVCSKP